MDNYNKFEALCASLEQEIDLLDAEQRRRQAELAWYEDFDLVAARFAEGRADGRLESLANERVKAQHKAQVLASTEAELAPEAALGLDPRRWFSAERSAKAKALRECRSELETLNAGIGRIRDLEASTDAERDRLRASVERYKAFDAAECQASIAGLAERLAALRPKLAGAREEAQRLALVLDEPLTALREQQRRQADLQRDIGRAEDLEHRMSRAQTSRDRAMVHNECSAALNESSPRRVLTERRRELAGVERTIEKLSRRLEQLASKHSRVIELIVVDGNNLCFEDRRFLGLSALLPLTQALVEKHRVIVVFDASIRRRLRMRDEQIAYPFPREVRIHVVGSKQAADETVLEAAAGPNGYVISNDAFRDFPEKAVVREGRLLRHVILDGRVHVHDLGIDVPFTEGQAASAAGD